MSEAVDAPPRRHAVCRVDELEPGGRVIATVGGRSIGVHRTEDRFYAVRNICPHQGAELCRGTVASTMMPSAAHRYVVGMSDRVIRCPWHGWEFDLETGRSLFDPDGVRVKTYPVVVEDGVVLVEMG